MTKREKIIRKIAALKFNEPLDKEMRLVNLIANSAIKIVNEVLTKKDKGDIN